MAEGEECKAEEFYLNFSEKKIDKIQPTWSEAFTINMDRRP